MSALFGDASARMRSVKFLSYQTKFPLAVTPVPDYKGATEARAPFVYRLGHQIFILGRGVRLP